jgi:hypothetical protein
MNRLLGTWVTPGESTAEVQYTVADHAGSIGIAAMDPNDGAATVQVVEFSDAHVCFVALWPSSGRESRCRLEIQSNGEAALTISCTDHARLVRRRASQSHGQSQQQEPVRGGNATPGQRRADEATDVTASTSEQSADGAELKRGDSNRTPRQGQQPLGQPPRQQQGDALDSGQQQQGSPDENTDDEGDTRPGTDHSHASGNN